MADLGGEVAAFAVAGGRSPSASSAACDSSSAHGCRRSSRRASKEICKDWQNGTDVDAEKNFPSPSARIVSQFVGLVELLCQGQFDLTSLETRLLLACKLKRDCNAHFHMVRASETS